MTARLQAASLVGIVLVVGCDSKGRIGMTSASAQPPKRLDGVSLAVRLTASEESQLTFEYTLTNRSDAPVYTFSMLYHTDQTGATRLDGNLVYVSLLEGPTVEFAKVLLEVRPWTKVEAPETPFLERVERGATQRGSVRVALPVRCYTPYDENYPEDYTPALVEAGSWRFALGVIREEKGLPIRHVNVGIKELYTVDYSAGITQQVILQSAPVAGTLAVLEPARVKERAFLRQLGQ